jgi:hypothetical protein
VPGDAKIPVFNQSVSGYGAGTGRTEEDAAWPRVFSINDEFHRVRAFGCKSPAPLIDIALIGHLNEQVEILIVFANDEIEPRSRSVVS